MWYWVKAPSGDETDYNLRELKTALQLGKLHLEWVARRHSEKRWMSVAELLKVEREDSDDIADVKSTSEQEQDPPQWRQRAPAAAFDCLKCGVRLRLRLQASRSTYRCPSCKTEYRSLPIDGDTPILLVVPASCFEPDSSHGSSNSRRTLPPEVRAALSVLSLDMRAIFENVRHAYRDQVKQYHPDRVAHLGPELRRVAELKTKEINAAYSVLERYYSQTD